MAESLNVGDVMRFSLALIYQIKGDPHSLTALVRVTQIDPSPDGTKVVWLEAVPVPEGADA